MECLSQLLQDQLRSLKTVLIRISRNISIKKDLEKKELPSFLQKVNKKYLELSSDRVS